jgi:hypothetical protein
VVASGTAVVGSMTNGILSYEAYPLSLPPGAANFAGGSAMGNLGHTGDDIAVNAPGSGSGGHATPDQVALYTWNGSGFTNYLNIPDPLPAQKGSSDKFGLALAIADVTGGTGGDLIVGANNSPVVVNGVTYSGLVLVYPDPVSPTNYISLTGVPDTNFGLQVAAGDIDGDGASDGYMDLVGVAREAVLVFRGPVAAGHSPSFQLPASVVATSGGGFFLSTRPDVSDVNGDGLADVLQGSSTTATSTICGGVAYLWLSAGGVPVANTLVLSTPVPNATNFGYAQAFGPGTRLFFVTDNQFNFGLSTNSGQVYIYKVN